MTAGTSEHRALLLASSPRRGLSSHRPSGDGWLSATSFALGRAAGWAVSPLFGLVSFTRKARTFHPRGPVLHATVTRHPGCAARTAALAERLSGPALVRFSGALWKNAPNWLDVLGCAIRLRADERATAEPEPNDQDLLFATIKRPWTMPFSPLTTNVHDYLGNDYFAVSPFDAGLESSVYLRLHPLHATDASAGNRDDKLLRELANGPVALELELSNGPFGPWEPLALVNLTRVASVDGEALRFRPFRTGRGLEPRGFIHALRLGVYAVSQRARPARSA